jgi:Domain of unknown function (DUF4145)
MDSYTIGGKWLADLNADLSGSDRSCAVLAGAILDDRLNALLQNYLLPARNKNDDKLLGRSGSIESFSSRIELARRLNLITEESRKSLDWVREIRNDAAHKVDFNFDDSSVRDKVANTLRVLLLKERAPALLNAPYNTHKGQFVAAVVMLVAGLEIEIGETHRTTHVITDALSKGIFRAAEG